MFMGEKMFHGEFHVIEVMFLEGSFYLFIKNGK
jgi:hypothetical protein